jgi:SAM-dependent methyltransferase
VAEPPGWPVLRDATRTRGARDALRLRQRWFGTPFRAVAAHVPRHGTVLDVGCGFGVLGALLALDSPARRVIGLDPDAGKIARGRAWYGHLPNVELRLAGAEEDWPPCDAVVFHDVLHHLPDAEAALRRAARVLRPGGVVVVKENDVEPPWKHAVSTLVERVAVGAGWTRSAPVRFRTRAAWCAALREAGLRVVHDTHLRAREGFFVPHSLFVAARP